MNADAAGTSQTILWKRGEKGGFIKAPFEPRCVGEKVNPGHETETNALKVGLLKLNFF